MTKSFDFKAELNASTHFYEVTTSLDSIYPNASVILANCINSRERSYNPNSNKIKEIEVAINNGLYKLGINGVFHRGRYEPKDGIIKTLIGGVAL